MLVKTEQGKTKDVSILVPNSNEYAVTAENYIVPKGEEGQYHVIIEIPQFSNTDGSRLSRPRIQMFGPKWFDSNEGRANLERQGYKLIILHDPREWVSKNAEELKSQKLEKAKEAAEAKAKADQEKADKEKADRDAEIAIAVKAALEAYGIKPEAVAAKSTPAKVEAAKSTETKNAGQ